MRLLKHSRSIRAASSVIVALLASVGSVASLSADECVELHAGSECADAWCCSLLEAQSLTGDWLGMRSTLAESGISFNADVTQFYMGVVDGGVERDFNAVGHADYVINLDSSKLGGPQGLFFKLRAEHRWGDGIGDLTGTLLPPALAGDLPTPDSDHVYLTNILFTQALSEQFAVFFGKLDTLDGDLNAYAHGRGKSQFSNVAFVATPVGLRTIPYSTFGAGFVVLGEGGVPIFTMSFLDPVERSTDNDISDAFSEGVTVAPELRVPVTLFDRPGHQLIGATWSSREYVALDQDPRVLLPRIPIARRTGSWSVYWNFDQTLFVNPDDETKGWGVFGRAGVADPNTNPIEAFLSFGVGGNSPIPGRSGDRFGVGWYYTKTSEELAPFIAAVVGGVGDSQGVELFYNAEVTPWFYLTPDVQYISPARDAVDDMWLMGIRGQIIF